MTVTWLITGANRGLGHAFAAAALRRGDNVAATARDTAALEWLREAHPSTLLPLTLDVTDEAAASSTVQAAKDHFGRLDVIVNNAGYGHFGAVEEITPTELRAQLDTNLFGPLFITRAALPILHAQNSGHIIQISSLGGIGAFANLGAYNASKWALEALTESLAQEVKRFGIAVTLIEPGGYATDWSGTSAHHSSPLPHYDPMRSEAAARRSNQNAGDPPNAAAALLRIVDAGTEAPLRVVLGEQALSTAIHILETRAHQLNDNRGISITA